MSKKTFTIGDCEFDIFTFKGEPYISTWDIANVLDVLNSSTGFSRFQKILNARPECKRKKERGAWPSSFFGGNNILIYRKLLS